MTSCTRSRAFNVASGGRGWVHVDVPVFGPEQRFNPPPTYTLHADRVLLYLGVLFVGVVGAWALGLLRRDVDEAGR